MSYCQSSCLWQNVDVVWIVLADESLFKETLKELTNVLSKVLDSPFSYGNSSVESSDGIKILFFTKMS